MRRLQKITETTSNFLEAIVFTICLILCVLMLFVVLVAVFYRYVLSSPLRWTEELARFSMIWMGLLGISLGIRRGTHLGVHFFLNKLPVFLSKTSIFITRLLVLYFLWIVINEGIRITILVGAHQISPGMQLSMFWPMLAVPVSGAVMAFQLILVIIIEALSGQPVSGEPYFLQIFKGKVTELGKETPK